MLMLVFFKIYSPGKNKKQTISARQKQIRLNLQNEAQSDLSVGSLCAILGNECFAFFDKMFEVLNNCQVGPITTNIFHFKWNFFVRHTFSEMRNFLNTTFPSITTFIKKNQTATNQYTHVKNMLKTSPAFEKTKSLKLTQKIPKLTALETRLTTYITNCFQTKTQN